MHTSESLSGLKVMSLPEISFSHQDAERILIHEDGLMVISVQVYKYHIKSFH